MNKDTHGPTKSGMCHGEENKNVKDFDAFNTFKNNTLIPFYGTIVAIQTFIGAINVDFDQLESAGLSPTQLLYVNRDTENKVLFVMRLVVALIPVVGTLINGALDIIAQLGLYLKTCGSSSVEREVENINPLLDTNVI